MFNFRTSARLSISEVNNRFRMKVESNPWERTPFQTKRAVLPSPSPPYTRLLPVGTCSVVCHMHVCMYRKMEVSLIAERVHAEFMITRRKVQTYESLLVSLCVSLLPLRLPPFFVKVRQTEVQCKRFYHDRV